MKASELRIGNLVYLVDKEKVWEILDGYEIDKCDENSLVEPILLTEELLLKFGFQTDSVMFWIKTLSIGHFKDGFYFLPNINRITQKGIQIKYVHHLQNLYWCLSGEELIDNGQRYF